MRNRLIVTEDNVLSVLNKLGMVLRNGHFVYSAGDHGSEYVDKRELVFPMITHQIGQMMAERIARIGVPIDVVLAPAVGAIQLGFSVALNLCEYGGMDTVSLTAEKVEGKEKVFEVKTRPDLLKGRITVVVEDVLNTGGSAARTVEAASALGARVIAVAALVNRGGVTAQKLGVKHVISLVDVAMEKHLPEACPLCKAQVKINTDVGHGKEFVAAHPEAASWTNRAG